MNISIDDFSSDPLTGARISYGLINEIPHGLSGIGWNVGEDCSGCDAQPDPSQVFNRTWHDTSTNFNGNNNIPFASVSFTGKLQILKSTDTFT